MASRKLLFKGFGACGPPANHFLKGLAFPRLAKVVSRMVWSFRAWRKSFPKWFEVSAHGESRFPNGLELVVAEIWKLTVQLNGHVRLLGHYYSVPHTYVGKKEYMKEKKNKRKWEITCNVNILYLFLQINNSNNQQKKIRLRGPKKMNANNKSYKITT